MMLLSKEIMALIFKSTAYDIQQLSDLVHALTYEGNLTVETNK